jgi:hypothetical protein
VNARSANACYDLLRRAELRDNAWNFSKSRATLAADATAPDWGRASAFELPSDFLCLINDYPEDNDLTRDYEIEGRKIYTDYADPLYIRYISDVTDTGLFDALFVEALASRMAYEMCEELTQSNSKKAEMASDYKMAIARARKRNAIENAAQQPPEDEWITVRR